MPTELAGLSFSPRDTSAENGTRNLSEAASQMKYRVRAECSRSASVILQATIAHRVDCHR